MNETVQTINTTSQGAKNAVRRKRSAYIQANSLIKRYLIHKKRHWFGVLIFDIAVPVIILCIGLYATISNHLQWVNGCQDTSRRVTGNNDTKRSVTINGTISTTAAGVQINVNYDQESQLSMRRATTTTINVIDQSRGPQSNVDETETKTDIAIELGQFLSQISISKKLFGDPDLYNESALALALWSIYLAPFCLGVHFLIEDKITGRRFLLYIHGLMKKPYYVAHYIALTVVPMLITILVIMVMSTVVAPDYLIINLLTFACFVLQTTSLQFFLASICKSHLFGTLLSFLVWTGHLFLTLALKFSTFASKEAFRTIRYVLQAITCLLPEQMVMYIYINDRKLTTGWDSVAYLKQCRKLHNISTHLWQSSNALDSPDVIEYGAISSQDNSNRDQIYFQMADKYLLLSSFVWTLVLMLLAYLLDDFSQSKPSENRNPMYNLCPCRSRIKTYRWDPSKPTMIKDSFASLSSHKSAENYDEMGGANGIHTDATGLNKKYFENIDLKHERYLGIYLDRVSKQLNVSQGSWFRFGDERTIVDGISFNVYKGEVTLLLGHNGAGKTTIMNMIVGKMRPTSGKVYVNGLDVELYNNESRFEMSMCPQDSIIFDYLTVYEHLELMAEIKQGIAINDDIDQEVQTINADHIRQHIAAIATEVGLRDQLGRIACKLSGGARRKLSLAMSFVSDSSILVLDEPSSGLDPESRKIIWDAIKRRKSNRTLLISTQHMEEADYLGDRVAIMNQGKITCCGSAVFLKRVLGSGNKVRLALMPKADRNYALQLVREFFPLAIDLLKDNQASKGSLDAAAAIRWKDDKTVNDMLIELKTSQKTEVEEEDGLIRLFEKLEADPEYHGIKSFSLHGSTVEDVLLNSAKITTSSDTTIQDTVGMSGGLLTEPVINRKLFSLIRASGRDVQQKDLRQIVVKDSCFRYTLALMVKTFLVLMRNFYSTILWRVIVPLVVFFYIFYSLRYTAEKYIAKLDTNSISGNTKTIQGNLPLAGFIYFETYAVPSRLFAFFAFIHCIIVLTDERKSKFKLIILNSRASLFNYWLAQYLADTVLIIVYLTMIFIYLNISIAALDDNGNQQQSSKIYGFDIMIEYGITAQLMAMLITFLFCSSILFICYILSLMCSGSISSCIAMVVVFFVGYITDLIVIFYKDLDIVWNTKDINVRNERLDSFLHYIVPSETYHLALASLLDVCLQYNLNKNDDGQKKLPYLFPADGHQTTPVLIQLLQLFVLISLLFIMEYCDLVPYFGHLYDSFFYTINSKNHSIKLTDDDVDHEKYRAYTLSKLIEKRALDKKKYTPAEQTSLDNSGIVMHEAVKVYSTGVRAVDDASFVVARNEIFGLLGVNGAGKTSIFRLLSSDTKPDSGKLFASYYNIVRKAAKSRQLCGYDPQAELSFDMTLVEVLYLMATLRGITNKDHTALAIQACLDLLDLHAHSDTLFHKLSTGTKKKLALAVAWIGSPPILLLDEPTSGIDPITRRNIWKSLTLMKLRARQSIVISSNAMEECEAICDRLAIISRGQIRCLGTVQNLSERFNQGYLLRLQFDSVKAPKARLSAKVLIETVNARLKKDIPSLIVDDTSVDSAAYKITDTRIPRSYILKILRQTRADFNGCISYMLSDATLDDVFLALAREQEKGDRIPSRIHSESRKRPPKRPQQKPKPKESPKGSRSSKISQLKVSKSKVLISP